MKIENIPKDKNLKVSSGCDDSVNDKKAHRKRIFCPVCGRYVFLDSVIAGICKDCFTND